MLSHTTNPLRRVIVQLGTDPSHPDQDDIMGDLQSFLASVMPDIRYRASLFVFRMDPLYQFCGDDDWEANAHPKSRAGLFAECLL